jgi:hypothetical protein
MHSVDSFVEHFDNDDSEIDDFGQKLDFVQSDIVRVGPRELLW